jgi:hypothetical protein
VQKLIVQQRAARSLLNVIKKKFRLCELRVAPFYIERTWDPSPVLHLREEILYSFCSVFDSAYSRVLLPTARMFPSNH